MVPPPPPYPVMMHAPPMPNYPEFPRAPPLPPTPPDMPTPRDLPHAPTMPDAPSAPVAPPMPELPQVAPWPNFGRLPPPATNPFLMHGFNPGKLKPLDRNQPVKSYDAMMLISPQRPTYAHGSSIPWKEGAKTPTAFGFEDDHGHLQVGSMWGSVLVILGNRFRQGCYRRGDFFEDEFFRQALSAGGFF